jgi:hypothetical protein
MSIFKKNPEPLKQDVWARPEMNVIFRAELMPKKNREERTFRIKEVLPNGRVTLHEFTGEHRENEFENIRF